MVKEGDEHKFEHVTVKIMTVYPYMSGTGRYEYLVGFKIKIGDWETPIGHFNIPFGADINRKIIETLLHDATIYDELGKRIGKELMNKLKKSLEEEG